MNENVPDSIRVESSFNVGRFSVDPRKNVIESDGRRVRLEPKVMRVLICLANRRGLDVSRDTILEEVWHRAGERTDVLTNAIWELRKAFGDDSHEPDYIQTVPGKGYRLIANVSLGVPSDTSTRRRLRRWLPHVLRLAIAFALGVWVASVACPH